MRNMERLEGEWKVKKNTTIFLLSFLLKSQFHFLGTNSTYQVAIAFTTLVKFYPMAVCNLTIRRAFVSSCLGFCF